MFFQGKTKTFIAWICPLLKSYVITEDEYIYFEGDDVGGMYFLKEGSCGFVLPKHNNVKYINVDIGSYFGIMDIVCSVLQNDAFNLDDWISKKDKMKRQFTIMSETQSDIMMLSI
jgi:hypothetical protein